MQLFGALTDLTLVSFDQNGFAVALEPNQATTYTADRILQLPPGDVAAILVSEAATQTLTNKTISGASNTITNVSLTTGVTGILPVANGGTNSNAALSNNRVIKSVGGAIVEAAAITAARALISDANGIPTQSVTTSAELAFVSGVTSAIQTQIDSKVAKAGDTMTGDLVMANRHAIQLNEATGGGTNFVAHRANAALAADTTYSWSEAPGTSGFVLSSDTSGNLTWVSNASVSSFKATWITADGTTKVITHNLGTTDVQIAIFNIADGKTLLVDSEARTDANTVTLVSSQAPAVSWRVLILAV